MHQIIVKPSIRHIFFLLSIVSFSLTGQVVLIPALGQTEDPRWKRYMDTGEEFRAKGDFAKGGHNVDQAIAEIERLAKQKPTPKLTESERLNCPVLVNNVASLAADQELLLNERRKSSSKATTSLAPKQSVGEIEKQSDNLNQGSDKREYEEISQAEKARFQRLESAFRKLFGSTAPETNYVQAILSALQRK
jgi:hypothetical protein